MMRRLTFLLLLLCSPCLADFPDNETPAQFLPSAAKARAGAVNAYHAAEPEMVEAVDFAAGVESWITMYEEAIEEREGPGTSDGRCGPLWKSLALVDVDLLDANQKFSLAMQRGQQGDDNPSGVGPLDRVTLYHHSDDHFDTAKGMHSAVVLSATGLTIRVAKMIADYRKQGEDDE